MSSSKRCRKRKPTPSFDYDLYAGKAAPSISNGVLARQVSPNMPPRPQFNPPPALQTQKLTAGQRIKAISITRVKSLTREKFIACARSRGLNSPGQMRQMEKALQKKETKAYLNVCERRGFSVQETIDLTIDDNVLATPASDDNDTVVSDSDDDEEPRDATQVARPAKVPRHHAARSQIRPDLVPVPISSVVFAPPDSIDERSRKLRGAPSAAQLAHIKPAAKRRPSHRSNQSVFEAATRATPPRRPANRDAPHSKAPATGSRRRRDEKPAAKKPARDLPSEPINLDSDDDEVMFVETAARAQSVSKRERARPRAENDALPRSDDARFRELTDEEAAVVASVTRGVRRNEVLMRVKAAGITLRGEDLACLRGCRWLNDEIMNSFAGLINARNAAATGAGADLVEVTGGAELGALRTDEVVYERLFKQGRPRTHVFNTFFFTRLSQHGYDYNGVRRWLRRAGRDVRELDLILFPINLGNLHWVLGAADVRNQQLLYLDSFLGGDECGAMPMLRRWLHDEVTDKHGAGVADAMGILDWPLYENPAYTARQIDGGSCGIFTLYAADFLERGVRPNFSQADVPLLRRRTVLFLRDGKLPE